ncbi:MAG: sigma-54 dependent transcriptional regulator [Gemmatimonadota bacterium]
MPSRILLVDDNADALTVLKTKLEHVGHHVGTAGSAEEALSRIKEFDPAVVITDLHMPGMNGIQLLERVKADMTEVDVIVATGHEDMSSAVMAMKAGAFDYLVKPIDLGEVESLVGRCLEAQRLNRTARRVQDDGEPPSFGENTVVGRDPRMIEIFKTIGVLARNRATVLIRGETGTGKEMIARAIHQNSAASREPFIAVNCTALSDTLLESELFGHVKGSFTGAVSSKRGYFELAGSGTIFLDEIGDTSPDFQTKLLRVLQERQFYPVGGEEPRFTEARVVAATHQPIEKLVEEGGFREDLYFRLKVVEIEVPPLRQRREDIPLLAQALLYKTAREMGSQSRFISEPAMRRLKQHSWPGNVRELENVLTRAIVLARGHAIAEEHISLGIQVSSRAKRSEGPDSDTLDAVIAAHVADVLDRCGGNKSQAARTLAISRSRLARILRKFNLDDGSDEGDLIGMDDDDDED